MKRKAIFLLYRLAETLVSPLVALYLLARVAGDRRYFPTLGERFGDLSALWQKTASEAIWLHAVSVGEVLAAAPLIEEIRRRSPAIPIFVSTTALAGRQMAVQRLASLTAGIFYAPVDYVWVVRRVLRRLRPSVVVILETEIWPNLYREAKRLGCGLILVNGRISDRALPGYKRYRFWFEPVLALCDRILAQSDEMRGRFVAAGAPAEIVETSGNLKYDFHVMPLAANSPVRGFANAARGRKVWIAASTSTDGRLDEEDAVITAQRELAGWRLILAPRKPDRFETVARKLEASGLRFARRSAVTNGQAPPEADVLLLDSIGELAGAFELADVVFMGGTLAEMGGHNILEPAKAGKPVIAGPHLENFREIEAHFEARRAMLRIASGDELARAVERAAEDFELGERGREAAAMQSGAASRTADAVMALYESRYPTERPAQPAWCWLWLLSRLWKAASARDLRRKNELAQSLSVPVISVGNVTAGGTGKTPMTLELLRDLARFNPGLLTRGHGRSSQEVIALRPGEPNPGVEITGDEVQLYLRGASGVPIGIGPQRAESAARLLNGADVGVFLLDDGLQHVQLRRDFDLVLIDALRPFGGGHPLPLGRLREPLEALARADALVVTRSRAVSNLAAIVSNLRKFNTRAPVYFAWLENRRWTNGHGETFEAAELAKLKSIAFCGLGNPESYWRSLADLSIFPMEQHSYGDHHRYTPNELRRLARHAVECGAQVLLTTAKDSANLCAEFEEIAAPLKVWWLEIGVGIDRRQELLDQLVGAISAAPASKNH